MIAIEVNQGRKVGIALVSTQAANEYVKCTESEEIAKTSYKVSHLLPCNMKPYLDDEIMNQAIVIFAEECCSTSIQLKPKKLQLRDDTVTRRIKCISNDQHDQLLYKSKILFTTRSHLIPQKTLPIQSNWLHLSGESCLTLRFTRNISLCDPFMAQQKEQIYFVNFRLLY